MMATEAYKAQEALIHAALGDVKLLSDPFGYQSLSREIERFLKREVGEKGEILGFMPGAIAVSANLVLVAAEMMEKINPVLTGEENEPAYGHCPVVIACAWFPAGRWAVLKNQEAVALLEAMKKARNL